MALRARTRPAAALVLAAVASGVVVAPAGANHPHEPGSPLPAVNMERVLLAAQLDPSRSGTAVTAGAKRSVLRVERALARRQLLARRYVDGSFGTATRSAYAAWQQRLGYSGIGANGLPGVASLSALGANRFRVVRPVAAGPRVTLPGGEVLDRRTNRMKMAAGARLHGRFGCKLAVVQGSYSTGVGASAGTHDGGGAMDVSVIRGCGVHHRATVRALRRVGFAAWYRPTLPGVWSAHIHAIAVSDPDLAGGAQAQVSDYYHGRDGLADNGPDNGPKVRKVTWEQYRRAH